MAHVNVHEIREQICDIGRRIYQREFSAANDGNITYRLNDNEVLCTPTMHCKGYLKPDDLSIIDMEGNQISGKKPRSSEALLHLQIYKERSDINSIVHCHPPHATAFAIAREPIPQCVLPEVEVFLGDVPITQYETPGSQKFADTIIPVVKRSNVIVLANHGTISYGESVERAYWWTEILDAYCRMLIMARTLGKVNYFTEPEERDLLELKQKWGFGDPRNTEEYKDCDICANDIFRDSWKTVGIERRAFEAPPAMPVAASAAPGSTSGSANNGSAPPVHRAASNGAPVASLDQEALIQTITERVVAALANAS
jgi:L-fuculose-phosphate aldolase